MSEPSILETVDSRKRQIRDRLTAIRNLRPGTPLSEPEDSLARRLFREIISLPESVDVVSWIETERGDTVAVLALERSLDVASQMYGLQNRSDFSALTPEKERLIHQSLRDKYDAMWGSLLRLDDGWMSSKQGGYTTDDPLNYGHIVGILKQLRRKINLPTELPLTVLMLTLYRKLCSPIC